MDHFAGLDFSVSETSVCFVDDTARPTAQMRFKWGGRWCNCHRRLPLFSLRTAQRVST